MAWCYFTAYLTTRGTLLSAINILAKRSELQKSLQREVDEVIGRDREPRLSDRKKCPLLEAVVLETLRYISHVPVLVLHATSQSTTIGGYSVAKVVGYCKNIKCKYKNGAIANEVKQFVIKEGFILLRENL